jgi:hypothetical protein
MSKKKRWVGARKANRQLSIARGHFNKAISIIDDYDIRTPEIDQADCVCDLAELETALYEIEDEHE